jgi:hypothetical protein
MLHDFERRIADARDNANAGSSFLDEAEREQVQQMLERTLEALKAHRTARSGRQRSRNQMDPIECGDAMRAAPRA